MSVSVEASELARRCAGTVRAGDSVKALIVRAARRSGLPASRMKQFWYREARAVRAEEMDCLRKAAGQAAANEGEDAARMERRELRDRLARIEALLRAALEDKDRPQA